VRCVASRMLSYESRPLVVLHVAFRWARDKMNPGCMLRIGGSSSAVGVCDAMHAKSRTRLRCSDTGLAAYR
jgi:hypothetical protein